VRVRIGDHHATSAVIGAAEQNGRRPTLVVPLTTDGQPLGEIACGPKEIGSFTDRDRGLLETLARHAALTASNAALSAELAARVQDLQASRVRILRAEEAGRRRVERDLHDGVQQELVGLLARLGLVANQLKRDPALAAKTLIEAHADARRTLEDLQELVRGIHPTLLTDRGLVAAVEERASRMPLTVRVESDVATRAARLPPDIEGAAYFAVAECLTNTAKHARAQSATVRFGTAAATMSVEVSDDGRGFDVETVNGTGLEGLRDRVEALGGRLAVSSGVDHGTRVSVLMPTGGPTIG
jgi:signal transduction histidine kinase